MYTSVDLRTRQLIYVRTGRPIAVLYYFYDSEGSDMTETNMHCFQAGRATEKRMSISCACVYNCVCTLQKSKRLEL